MAGVYKWAGFPEVIESVYPRAEVQTCIVHMIRASLSYVNWKQRKPVAADLRLIYQAATAQDASEQLDAFAQKWDAQCPMVSQIWRRHWDRITPFLAYPAEIRKVIYTTNAVESLNMSLRKLIKMRGSFPNEEAALKFALPGVTQRVQEMDEADTELDCGIEPLQHSVARSHSGRAASMTTWTRLAGENWEPSYGNDGAVESQHQAFHSSLEISQKTRDSHIPTAPATAVLLERKTKAENRTPFTQKS